MIEIYDFAGEKFLKWVDKQSISSYELPVYTAVTSILSFGRYDDGGTWYLGFTDKHYKEKAFTTYLYDDYLAYLKRDEGK